MKLKLAPILGDDDLIIGSIDEITQAGLPLTKAMNQALKQPIARLYYMAGRVKGASDGRAKNAAIKRVFKAALGENPPHPTAKSLADFAGPYWGEYTKFSFTRNPFDRAVSDYFWRKRATGKDFSFAQFLDVLEHGKDPQGIAHTQAVQNWDMMTIDGVMQMDFVGRYEQLQDDFGAITDQLGLGRLCLDVASKKFDKITDYGELYGPDERKAVYALFEREIDHFKYAFPF